MSLGQPIGPPELARLPLLFRETFRDRASVERGGATLVGTGTTFNDGVVLNGSGNLSYAVSGSKILRSTMTIKIEFTPGFAANDGVDHYIFRSDNVAETATYFAVKDDANRIRVFSGGADVLTLAYAAWSAAWLAGQKNSLIISTTTGATLVWLNGTLIGTSVVAWAPKNSTVLAIGARNTNAQRFIGTIHSFEIYGSVATAADEPHLRDGSIVSDIDLDKALAYLPGKSCYVRPSTTNLLVDGNMEAVGVGAYGAANAVLTKETTTPHGGTQCLRVTIAAVTGYAYQTVLTVGRRYRITGWARSDGTNLPLLWETSNRWVGTTSTSWQYFDVIFTASTTQPVFMCYRIAAGYVEFDDITVNVMETVTEVQGKAGITEALMGSDGTTTTQFPTVARGANLVRGFGFDGGDQINLGDSDLFSFTDGAVDKPFTLACLASQTLASTQVLIAKSNGVTSGEYQLGLNVNAGIVEAVFLLIDETGAAYIGRTGSLSVKLLGALTPIVATCSGSGTVAGLKIYVGNVRVDTANTTFGVYARMRNTARSLRVGNDDSGVVPMRGSVVLPCAFDYEASPLQAKALGARLLQQSRRG